MEALVVTDFIRASGKFLKNGEKKVVERHHYLRQHVKKFKNKIFDKNIP